MWGSTHREPRGTRRPSLSFQALGRVISESHAANSPCSTDAQPILYSHKATHHHSRFPLLALGKDISVRISLTSLRCGLHPHTQAWTLTFGQCTEQGSGRGCGHRISLSPYGPIKNPQVSSSIPPSPPEASSKPEWLRLLDTRLLPDH